MLFRSAPILADEVFAEVARLDDPQPARGFTEVELGKETEFVYLLRAEFAGGTAPGFDARLEERRVGKECRSRLSPYH